ncbi:hypothetical protein Aco04nite_69810 [Winogradskya consettensis]|uniref:Uncharacterized protein n=1 Tax=Winogradskya consettensis TaxID=113560 RepID=A0A919W584_9ACTN|nr:hypothetical protein Aco04nite_69810 [Actinoplanes consettensis]
MGWEGGAANAVGEALGVAVNGWSGVSGARTGEWDELSVGNGGSVGAPDFAGMLES